jgi:hypothetical protein
LLRLIPPREKYYPFSQKMRVAKLD